MNPQTPDNEAARLRELLVRVIEIADEFWKNQKQAVTVWHGELADELEKIKAEAQLAPAPEEPVSIPTDLNQQNKANTLSLNEWRELGPDEVIQEGDERTDRHRELGWRKAENSIGTLAWKWSTLKFRTRRPLPKQEEIPLENDIASIEWSCGHTARAIRYLRDEIQKLKEAK
jgi:hypothetical protein